MVKRILKSVIVFLVVGGIVLFAVFKVKQRKKMLSHLKRPSPAPLPVEVVKIKEGKLPVVEHYLAEIRPVLSFRISSRISGFLLYMNKYEGDRVKKGEIIARIDARQIKNRIASIKAEIEGAESDVLTKKHIYERDFVLYKNKALSKERYEISKTAYELALSRLKSLRYELRSAEVDLSYALIKSPFDGIVLKRFHEPGDLIVPGTPIVEVESPEKGYRIIVRVPQKSISSLKPGGVVYLVEGKKRIKQKIYSIHPAVETGTLGAVEIRTKERPFGLPTYGKVGVDIVISIPYGKIVPLRSLLENVNTTYIFVARYKDKKRKIARVHIIPVKVLGRNRNQVVIKTKELLRPDDMVIVADESTLLRLYEGEIVYPVMRR